jgi:hypothetical protein
MNITSYVLDVLYKVIKRVHYAEVLSVCPSISA